MDIIEARDEGREWGSIMLGETEALQKAEISSQMASKMGRVESNELMMRF